MLFVCGRGRDKEGGYHRWQFWQTRSASSDRFGAEVCVCTCVCARVCTNTCMLCMSILYKGGAGLAGGHKKVQSWVTQYNKHVNILNTFSNDQQPGTQLGACAPFQPFSLWVLACVNIYGNVYVGEAHMYVFSLLSQHPYPSEEQKKQLAQDTGLTILQVNNWWVKISACPISTTSIALPFIFKSPRPPSPHQVWKTVYVQPSPLHIDTHGGARADVHTDSRCSIIIRKLLGCSGVIGEVFHR